MDGIRESLSRLKEDVKHRLKGRKRKGDLPETGGRTGESETSDSLPRPIAGAAAGEDGSDWKATVSASAKIFLRGVRDSADAFGPLKSVAGGLCFLLENYEVRFPCNVCPRSL